MQQSLETADADELEGFDLYGWPDEDSDGAVRCLACSAEIDEGDGRWLGQVCEGCRS